MNILMGAVSGNYSINDINRWILSAKKVLSEDDKIVLLLYNSTKDSDLFKFLIQNNIEVLQPDFDFYGVIVDRFETNTGTTTQHNSANLVHNIRFLHSWIYLKEVECEYVLMTDVKDVYFNRNPFTWIKANSTNNIITSSEAIKYKDHAWNMEHLYHTFGLVSSIMQDNDVYNVGVVAGKRENMMSLFLDIYLNALSKVKVADQTSFNYLINNTYKSQVQFTNLKDYWAVHLHVINEGHVKFNLEDIEKYTIVHQYDRLPHEIQHHYTIQK